MTNLSRSQRGTTNTLAHLQTLRPIALCRHYFNVQFDEQCVQVFATGETWCELTVTWAVGVLPDGDWEALGAWPGGAVGSAFWLGVSQDLDYRGVDKISLICAADLDARALYPWAKVLPRFRGILGLGHVPATSSVGVLRAEARRAVREASGIRAASNALERLLARSGMGMPAVLSPDWPEVLEQFRPFYSLRPHRRAVVCAGDQCLERLGLSLNRAVARHGPFADLAAAVSFVAKTISRDELRLKFSGLSKVTRPRLRLVGSESAGLASPGH